jgi:hypothetical protein
MRGLADPDRLRRFFDELAREAVGDVDVYVTGGATAVLLGWRASTIDADILMVPEQDARPCVRSPGDSGRIGTRSDLPGGKA